MKDRPKRLNRPWQIDYNILSEDRIRFPLVAVVEKTPNNGNIKDDHFIVVKYKRKKYWVLFKCPCGCGHVISLSLQKHHRPCWSLKVKHGRPSLTPSIWQISGCKSHFFITNGVVQWCGRDSFIIE